MQLNLLNFQALFIFFDAVFITSITSSELSSITSAVADAVADTPSKAVTVF